MFQSLVLPVSTFIVGVSLGFIFGWMSHKHISKTEIQNWERALITVMVSIAWVISVVLDIVLQTYETPVAVHGVMGMVVGYFFEGSLFNRK